MFILMYPRGVLNERCQLILSQTYFCFEANCKIREKEIKICKPKVGHCTFLETTQPKSENNQDNE